MKKFLSPYIIYFVFIILLFLIDRFTKIYIINLQESGTDVDLYINSFLNFYLVWNTGIGFGLVSIESNIFYHSLTFFIAIINLTLIYFLIKSKDFNSYLLILILGGSSGNLFDRVYYYAVPDFIDLHIGDFHWFVFNVADIFITVGIVGLILAELFKKDIIVNKE